VNTIIPNTLALPDELGPLAADVPRSAGPDSLRPPRTGRAFGAVLGFLAIWQVVTPGSFETAACGWFALGVTVLWFVGCPRYVRWLATAALVGLTLVVVRLGLQQ
jgi:hypothetical protein